ncbi:hypothetical protein [Paenibacillus humicola]|uniref:hypothetical protein n=1 Tax=Paenibacillus humicola TaxID=3110540 RepID=UPI00237A7E81|nr:hypothetical protein [Paenibacillus humicola]
MGENVNYNRNRRGRTDNNDQRDSEVHGGEFRNGRLSQFKNNNPFGHEVPNEYIDKAERNSLD